VSSAPWFYMSMLPPPGGVGQLTREEVKHALGAKRLSVGDEVTLFDGRGGVAIARLGAGRTSDGSMPVEIVEHQQQPAPSPPVIIATAIPKGDRWSTLLDMATQLGATAFAALDCERSVVRSASLKRARVERILIEACKQSRRAWVPRIDPPGTPPTLASAAIGRGAKLFIAHPGGLDAPTVASAGTATAAAAVTAPAKATATFTREQSRTIVIMVGPEGGFTDDEVAAVIGVGATPISLGSATLRVETAVVAALALCRLA